MPQTGNRDKKIDVVIYTMITIVNYITSEPYLINKKKYNNPSNKLFHCE
jgi:hypothetical protein